MYSQLIKENKITPLKIQVRIYGTRHGGPAHTCSYLDRHLHGGTTHTNRSYSFCFSFAATDLIKNVQVKAIIGPQTSSQAQFVMELGNKAHMPILSFSATSAFLSNLGNHISYKLQYVTLIK